MRPCRREEAWRDRIELGTNPALAYIVGACG